MKKVWSPRRRRRGGGGVGVSAGGGGGWLPVGHDPGVDALEVLVDGGLVVLQEALLVAVRPDHRQPRHRLAEVGVDGRTGDRVQPPQLPGGGHVDPL